MLAKPVAIDHYLPSEQAEKRWPFGLALAVALLVGASLWTVIGITIHAVLGSLGL